MVNRKVLDPESSPEAAYGARVRRLREARAWSQEDLAAHTAYSSKHVSAVETARKPPTLPFSRALDLAFGTAGTADSFEREWRELRHGALLEGFPEYVEHEGRAVELRLFDTGIVPGLLQTSEYARCLADSKARRGAMTPDQADDLVAFLAERQATLVRHRPPTMLVVMDESCIRRQVGGPRTMGAQLDHLLEFAERPNTVLQIAPFEIGEQRALYLPTNLLTMPNMTVVAYAESQIRGYLERDSAAVFPLLTAYHQLQAEALPQSATVDMIREVRKGYP
ncbi:helix-turn-helix transcriptional regulator [Streptomyces sp. TRM76323]|uniref:Helix-turn-helix transcriptional regulator n=1 Tax=Streptomyces tamarix TaxID=3078565 RepID=A0ABU3QGF4_9ACTN|nr:helix-turn-helix transcriptional regulator [Streptomyces tamarix]MDT9681472.1 helix-turn-helix transcriptional regulator [Streptomyces tamarix]